MDCETKPRDRSNTPRRPAPRRRRDDKAWGDRAWLAAGVILFGLGIALGAAATDRLRAGDPVAPSRPPAPPAGVAGLA